MSTTPHRKRGNLLPGNEVSNMTLEALSTPIRLESLSDGTTVVLRPPDLDDLERSLRFFRELPKRERKYLRFDITQRQVVERLIREAQAGRACRILALVNGTVVGHGALELSRGTWQSHIGEIRAIVAPRYRRRGLGAFLIRMLFRTAEQRDLEKVIVQLAGPQFAARTACERLGFLLEAVLRNHVKDADGKTHDLIVMSCDLDDVSRTLREFYREEDRHPLD